MIFTILRNFSGIFLNLFRFIFDFYLIKTIKKLEKMGAFIARAHVDVTWHARPRGSATWTRASAYVAPVMSYLYLLVLYMVIVHISIR